MTATRSPRPLFDRLTLSGAPMPRTTSHSVWPSATVPEVDGAGPPAACALASAAPGGGAMPGQPPSALTRSSASTGLSGVSGGVSIETLRTNTRPVRENQSASRDRRSDAPPEQPAITGASTSNASSGFRLGVPSRTLNHTPAAGASSVQDRGSPLLFTHIHPHHVRGR